MNVAARERVNTLRPNSRLEETIGKILAEENGW